MKSFFYIFIFFTAVISAGCAAPSTVVDSPAGGVRIALDMDYIPAIGEGFHWTVTTTEENEESLWDLQVIVNDTVVCGSEFGLPTDIYLGYWNMKSAEFFFAEQTLPENAVPVKITFVFAEGTTGQASGFIFSREGENIFVSQALLLTKESPAAALFEVDASAKKRTNKDIIRQGTNIVLRHDSTDYIPANAVQLCIRPALKPGQIPVGEPDVLSHETSIQEQ